ncbi:carboxymuconolactone decarboxylase family protein [Streptomyces sp. NBC_01217]|nr:carboxymuconolactone decarboxylase family protein [Streptomyces sp. NBC_01217]
MTGPFRYTSPVPPKSATGTVADVYTQLSTDFGIDRAPTFAVLSVAPPLLAGAWAVMRESLLAGRASRTEKEVVAAGVSLVNRCPFCVDAHTMLLHATGAHRLAETIARGEEPKDPVHRRLLAWGKDMSTEQPFPAGQAAEYIGTAFAFHFINRIVSSLLTKDTLPGGVQRFHLVRSVAGRTMAGTVRRELTPGTSLALLETEGEPPWWAAGTAVGFVSRTPGLAVSDATRASMTDVLLPHETPEGVLLRAGVWVVSARRPA